MRRRGARSAKSRAAGLSRLTQSVRRDMKIMRFILGLVGFIVVWVAVAALGVLVVHAIFPGAGGEVLGVHWAAIPGNVVGVVAGYRVYQRVSGDRPRKVAR